MTLEEHLAEVDAMLSRGVLHAEDHALAHARAKAATRRGQPLPPMPSPSRIEDRRFFRRSRRQARAERHATGMSRADQQSRDAVTAARDARDAEVVRLRAVADRTLAAGRMTATEHADTVSRLERLAREPVRPVTGPVTGPAPALSGLARLAAVLDGFAD